MALKPCRECGQSVSAEAATCPHCGVRKPARETRRPKDKYEAATAGCLGLVLGPVGLWYKGRWAAGFIWLTATLFLAVASGGIALPFLLWIGMAIHAAVAEPRAARPARPVPPEPNPREGFCFGCGKLLAIAPGDKCPHCGLADPLTPFSEVKAARARAATPGPVKTRVKTWWLGLSSRGRAGALIGGLAVGIGVCTVAVPSGPIEASDWEIRSICKEAVLGLLIAPSQADIVDSGKIYRISGDTVSYSYTGTVDAPNSFGVMLRKRFSCDVYWRRGEWNAAAELLE